MICTIVAYNFECLRRTGSVLLTVEHFNTYSFKFQLEELGAVVVSDGQHYNGLWREMEVLRMDPQV
jgi:hypothetical protein